MGGRANQAFNDSRGHLMALKGEYVRSPSSWAAKQAEEYEASGGTKANTMAGKPVVILTTRGRRTGKLRKAPLMRVEHGGDYAVVASLGGSDHHPEWYLNLVADPHVALQDGPEPEDRQARVLSGDERKEWWARAAEAFPTYDTYQTKTKREIPIILLQRNLN